MYEINVKDVIDYCWCPIYYNLKKRNSCEYNLKELYDKTLHDVFYSYLTALQRETVRDRMGFLKFRWGKEWIKQKTNSEIICTPSAVKRDTYEYKRRAGIDAIITFSELMNDDQYPIIINKEYSIPINDKIILKGKWEYVREIEKSDKTKSIQILKFRTESNKFQILSQMNHDLELTAASLAFKNMFNVDDFELLYVDIYKKKIVSSYRTKLDYDTLIKTVIDTVKCIKDNIELISPDKKCFHCEYRNECKLLTS